LRPQLENVSRSLGHVKDTNAKNFRHIMSSLAIPATLVCATICCSPAMWGQATTGTISGHVTEQAGNVVARAQISVQNLDKGLITTATTDNSGDFTLPAMPPDHYKIVIEKSGFATATVPAFRLDIDQRANFNVPLKVGEVSMTVTVTDSAPVLQTQGAETGEVIGSREIADLPTLGRDFSTLLFLVPGVVSGTKGPTPISMSRSTASENIRTRIRSMALKYRG